MSAARIGRCRARRVQFAARAQRRRPDRTTAFRRGTEAVITAPTRRDRRERSRTRRRRGPKGAGQEARSKSVGARRAAPRAGSDDRVQERYRSGHNGTDSKSVGGIAPHVGSNPTLSAKQKSPASCGVFCLVEWVAWTNAPGFDRFAGSESARAGRRPASPQDAARDGPRNPTLSAMHMRKGPAPRGPCVCADGRAPRDRGPSLRPRGLPRTRVPRPNVRNGAPQHSRNAPENPTNLRRTSLP